MYIDGRIELTESDARRLTDLALHADGGGAGGWAAKLQQLLARAVVVEGGHIQADRITMNSLVRLQDAVSGEEVVARLVYPGRPVRTVDAGSEEFNVSILSPMGLSMIGRRTGDLIGYRIRIMEVLYQPEAAGEEES
ncbi:MAG TPA: GreA/GreB family elongation factor [Anaerohalosphaeraceae bacterium]|jgi:regulator of nucleoside diphosphate kinase|nr:GreA/GreB family elongation factor [Anaerohalosphaeraceae bacterium]HRT50474.1 GreA/GreB family elongation factor [Anaerohalosphaeraceae bacterium]HRT86404.1 GreA/GreB family elongation factor [Anaerohalosphaeraceae bacterium]